MKSKSIAFLTATVLGSLSQIAPAASDVEILRQRCAEQERQIKELEKEVDSLHSLIERDNRTTNAGTLSVSTAPQTTNSTATHTVRSGDSMSKIAKMNSLSLGALMKANSGVNPNKLRVGQKIVIPGKTAIAAKAAAPAASPAPQPAAASASSYTVKGGDTVYSIARAHRVSPQTLIDHNGKLNPNSLRVGQKISIPSGTAKSTVASAPAVAKAPQAAVAKQQPAPKPQPQVAAQPKPQPTPAVAKAPTPQREEVKQVSHQPSQPKVRTVTVDKQMTFGDFASQYGADIAQINELNGLSLTKSTVLAQGSELYVPGQQH